MKISRRIIYFLSAVNIVQSNFHWKTTHEDQAIREMLRSAACQDVIVRIQERNMDDRMKRLLEVVSEAVMDTWPTRTVVSARLWSVSRSPNAASSRTLLIYLYPSLKVLDYRELNVVLQEVSLMSRPKHLPRLLLVCASTSDARTLSALHQLRYLWHLKFLNAVVLEVSFPPRQPGPVFVAAHLYNGFAERYTRLNISHVDGVDWYPDKSRNMHGSRLRVTFKAAAPYGTLDPVSGRFGGLVGAFADAVKIVANATLVSARNSRDSDLAYDARVLLHTDRYSTSYEHTVSVDDDKICLLLPVLPRPTITMNITEIVMSIVMGFIITTIVWSASVTLSVNDRMRQPANIISQILCITPSISAARTTIEKLLYATIMLATAEYANVFHAELFRFNIKYRNHMLVSSFKDLYGTGLEVLVPPLIYETIQTVGPVKRLPPAFLERFRPSAELEDGRDTKLNITKAYFMLETSGKLAELTKVDGAGRRLFRLYDLCVMHFYRVHTLPVRSPYREELDKVLLMMTEHGFTKKYLDEYWEGQGTLAARIRDKFVLRDYSKYIAIVVVYTGCLLSIVVFIGELIVGLLSARKHSPRASVVLSDYPGVEERVGTTGVCEVRGFRGAMFEIYDAHV